MTAIRRHFDSTRELLEFYRRKIPNRKNIRRAGYEHLEGAPRGEAVLENGSDKFNAAIEEAGKEIWENIPTLRRVWKPALVGAFPHVPAFLAGGPEAMWRLQEDRSEHTPIRIWIGTTSSWSITEEQLMRRGAVLAAFAQALAEVRPVYLTPYTSYGEERQHPKDAADFIISWDLQTAPIIMSGVAPSLCDINVVRYLTLAMAHTLQDLYELGWAGDYQNEEIMRQKLGCSPEDIWLGPIHLYDPLLKDPIGWVKKRLKKYLDDEE